MSEPIFHSVTSFYTHAVSANPDACAFCMGKQQYTYRDLQIRSNMIAASLQERFPAGSRIGILMSRSFALYTAIWGILSAGMVLVPMDAGYPQERIDYILSDSEAAAVLCDDSSFFECTASGKLLVSDLKAGNNMPAFEPVCNPDAEIAVFYTSGSSGKPKGILTKHAAMAKQIMRFADYLGLDADSRFLFKTPVSFHASIYEYLMCMYVGGCACILESGAEQDIEKLVSSITDCGVTELFAVPSMLQNIAQYCRVHHCRLDSLRHIWAAGEALYQATADQILRYTDAALFSALGGSEYAGLIAAYRCEAGTAHTIVPVGKILDGIDYLLLDEAGKPAKQGVLYINTDVTGSRYKDAANNEGRFLTDAANHRTLFCSNDLFTEENGILRFLGRTDDVVKIRGMRVDPGEIEACLCALDSVADSVVLAEHEKLTAYLVPASACDDTRFVRDTAEALQKKLPAYMIPAVWILADSLPKLTSGKHDRKKLENNIGRRIMLSTDSEKPQNDLQSEIFLLWSEMLQTDAFGIHDSFMQLGGVSIEIAEMIGILSEWHGAAIRYYDFMEQPTVAGLAALIETSAHGACSRKTLLGSAEAQPYGKPFSLTSLQQSYLAERQDGSEVSTHTYFEVFLRHYDYNRICAVLQKLTNENPALRIAVRPDGMQYIQPASAVRVQECIPEQGRSAEETLHMLRQTLNRQILKITRTPLFEMFCVPAKNGSGYAVFLTDNLILDGMSCMRLASAFSSAYCGEESSVPQQYTFYDYAAYLRRLKESAQYQRDEAFWLEEAKHFPEAVRLPAEQSGETQPEPALHVLRLSQQLWDALNSSAGSCGISVFILILTAVIQVLSKFSYEQKFLIGVPGENRPSFEPAFREMLGAFSSFYLFPCDVNTQESFADAANKYQKQLWNYKEHDSFDAIELLRAMNQQTGSSNHSVSVVFTSLPESESSSNAEASLSYLQSHTAHVDLEIVVYRAADEICVNFTYLQGHLSKRTVSAFSDMLLNLLEQIAKEPDAVFRYLTPALPSADCAVIAAANDNAKPVPEQSVRDLLLEGFSKNSAQIAIAEPDKTYTYAELKETVFRIAAALDAQTNEKAVAVYLPKSTMQIAAVLGTVFAGKAYLPVEYDYPPERVIACIRQAGVEIVLTDPESSRLFENTGISVLVPETVKAPADPAWTLPPVSDLFVLIYTSGSTGKPKAVKVLQKGVVNCLLDTLETFSVSEQDTAIALTNIAHDMSMFDMFGMLAAGGCIAVPRESDKTDALAWHELITRYHVTVWNSVPALMENYLDTLETAGITEPLPLRLVFLGGDKIAPSVYPRLRQLAPSVKAVSVGGPTETTLWNIWHIMQDTDIENGFIPYGKPIQNTAYSIRNENLEQMPVGAEGMMFCEGIGVTAGYLNREEETTERFQSTENGSVRYMTGDIGCYLPDGDIRITGRKDHQIKLLGKRIETGEIERTIQQYPGIRQCVVCTDGTRLSAFLLAAEEPDQEKLRAYLFRKLPAYMIPSRFCTTEAFPLTFNGKIDRAALLRSLPQETKQQNTAPLSASAQKLYQIICEVLGLETFDPSENLYYLGMNSLNAILILNRLQLQHGIRIPVREFMEQNTLRAIAAMIPEAAEPIQEFRLSPEKRYEPFPLTELQEAYVVGRDPAIPLGGRPSCGYGELQWKHLDTDRLTAALNALVKRHDALRCIIRSDKSQVILRDCPLLTVPVTDLSDKSPEEQQAWIQQVRKESERICIPPEELPKFRFSITKLSAEDSLVHMYFDLLIADGWSIHLFLDELDALYCNPSAQLPPASVSFHDYSDYKEMLKTTVQYEADKAYWLNRIPDLPEAVSLPLLCDPSELKTITTAQEECSLDLAEWEKLNTLAQAYSVTPFAVLFTVFNHVILRWNQKQRLLMCMPETDRPMFHPDVKNMMGECSSFYVFTAEHISGQTFAEAVRATQEQLWQLYEHKLFTGVEVLREIYKYRDSYGQALIPIVFSTILNYPPAQKQNFSMVYDHTFTSQIMVDIDVQRIGDRIKFNWNFVEGLLSKEMVHEMAAVQTEMLHCAIQSESFWQQPFSIPLPERSRNLIEAANASGGTLSVTRPLCAYLREAFRQYSENTCICYDGKTYSYAQIHDKILAIGARFRSMGLYAGDSIAIHCKKSAEQTVAILAAVYSGLVYVPLEYELPEQTVLTCFKRCDCKAMVLSAEKAARFKHAAATITAETLFTEHAGAEELPDITAPDLEAPFAVIHTSGSTGMPKAVVLKQKGIVNALLFSHKEFEMCETDRTICLTNIAHDMSMFDLFGTVLCGGCMVIPRHEQSKDPLVWKELIRTHGVTVWNSVPAMMEMLLAVCEDDIFPSVRLVISGGDYLLPESARTIFSVFPGVRLVNVGGPTETTLWNIYHNVTPEEAGSGIIPYGKPISNTQYYLLNEALEQVPADVVGMMYCGGTGITAGYLKDEKQTAEKYIMTRYSDTPLYCTGDLGKYDENGNIIFMGRSDRQIKINGKRIELTGINEILRSYTGVRNSAVKLGSNQKTIFGYYTADTELDEAAIKDHMLSYLPQYMIPQHIIRLETIPLTANGKLDQAALPETVTVKAAVTASADAAEEAVVRICKELLCNDAVTPDTNFFISGGNSLLALRFLTLIQEQLGVAMTMTDIFTGNSLRDWCDVIRLRMPEA